MHYLQNAFNSFGPRDAAGAAIRFILEIIFEENLFDELLCTLTDKSRYGGFGGDPGWELARKNSNIPADSPAYKDWPQNAEFRAIVDDTNAKTYLTRAELYKYINHIMKVFVEHDPEHKKLVQPLMDFIESGEITSEAGMEACKNM